MAFRVSKIKKKKKKKSGEPKQVIISETKQLQQKIQVSILLLS